MAADSPLAGDELSLVAVPDITVESNGGRGWRAFLETVYGHESDKKAWEVSPGPTDFWVYATFLVVQVDLSELSEGAIRLLARMLADYACPAVQVDGRRVYHAPYRIVTSQLLRSTTVTLPRTGHYARTLLKFDQLDYSHIAQLTHLVPCSM
ncbi:hypothetical protein HPB47_023896 [Ixodes persulcatus]|uniref:Uncharacterized protein n=1 Tax=Ixodes persulcatus TaxID=34615 RepID=A0AC60Q8R9_IXOPE|nr:hypothetical protein HPB47_023896 [Ixodes persulcatus]